MKMKRLRLAIAALSLITTAVVVQTNAEERVAKAGDAKVTQDAAHAAQPKSDHWSYQPIRKPSIPQVAHKEWVRTNVDAFIAEQLEAKGLSPSPDASKETLVRRLSLDLLGLIPDPAVVKAFVEDSSPDAYEKLVERFLASPQYGERQARKWLDLARYADSSGFQNDNDRLNMWRYRDYVINAFNDDKPYDRFIQEQIAGDELFPGDEQALIATGFMAQYPDNSNSRDMVQRHYQIVTDITDTVGEVILGQTFECARCHDHKFDPISQKDYYSLQSFFSNISVSDNIPVSQPTPWDAAYTKAAREYEEATREINAKIDAVIDLDREEALKYHKERYLTDTREAIFKPESEWTALDRWINHRLGNVTGRGSLINYFEERARSVDPEFHSDWHAEKLAEIEALQGELRAFNNLRPAAELGSNKITAMTELGYKDAPPTYVLFGGDHERPLEEVQPAFPAALTGAQPEIPDLDFSSGRRAALAKWLTSADNPLTARVYVNRIWDQYFGRGIVETVSDFGKAGTKPSNQALLDYLAARFIESGWSVKELHREIVLSSVYRQSSAERPEIVAADPENRLLGVFPRRRLEAEQIRDSLLAASGKLNPEVGGPSVFPPLPKTGRSGADSRGQNNMWRVSQDESLHNRRSLYVFTRRSLPYPLLDVFNMASPQEAHSKREITTTPLQALTLINSEIIYDWSRALAGRVINESGLDEDANFDQLYQILFARLPSDEEREVLKNFLDAQEQLIRERSHNGAEEIALPTGTNVAQLNSFRASAFVDLVHTVANSNEAIYRY